jgi:hypothetical protein
LARLFKKLQGTLIIKEKVRKKEKEKRILSPYARAFKMFKDQNSLADVAIELDIKTDEVLSFHADYL